MRWWVVFFLWSGLAWAQSPVCGNGAFEVGERCDDGNTANGDGCSETCTPEFCGDKVVNLKGEACDDGNQIPDDGCSNTCTLASSSPEKPTDQVEVETKALDPDEAFRRSLVVSLFAPPGLGLVYGPSLAHIAAGEKGRAAGMIIARAALVGGALGIRAAFVSNDIDAGPTALLLALDGAIFYSLVVADLLDGPRAVKRAMKGKEKEEKKP